MNVGDKYKWNQTGACDNSMCAERGFCVHAPKSQRDHELRIQALSLAVQVPENRPDEIIKTASVFLDFIKGDRQ